jgi:hypothetical protein
LPSVRAGRHPGAILPRNPANRKLFGRFSGIVLAAGRRIDNPPQVANLPHKIIAAREEMNGWMVVREAT